MIWPINNKPHVCTEAERGRGMEGHSVSRTVNRITYPGKTKLWHGWHEEFPSCLTDFCNDVFKACKWGWTRCCQLGMKRVVKTKSRDEGKVRWTLHHLRFFLFFEFLRMVTVQLVLTSLSWLPPRPNVIQSLVSWSNESMERSSVLFTRKCQPFYSFPRKWRKGQKGEEGDEDEEEDDSLSSEIGLLFSFSLFPVFVAACCWMRNTHNSWEYGTLTQSASRDTSFPASFSLFPALLNSLQSHGTRSWFEQF